MVMMPYGGKLISAPFSSKSPAASACCQKSCAPCQVQYIKCGLTMRLANDPAATWWPFDESEQHRHHFATSSVSLWIASCDAGTEAGGAFIGRMLMVSSSPSRTRTKSPARIANSSTMFFGRRTDNDPPHLPTRLLIEKSREVHDRQN